MDIEAFFNGLSSLFASGDLDKVSEYLKQSLARAEASGAAHAEVTILNEMIGYYRSVSNHSEALAASERAVEAMRRLGYEDTPDFGTTLLNAATAYRAAGDRRRSLALYEQALAVYQRHLAPDDPRLAGLYNNLSALHMESGEYAAAAALLRKSARIMADRKKYLVDAATVYSNLALALSRSGDEGGAGEALRAAVAIFESLDDGGRQAPHYAAALSALAETRYKTGDHADAARLYEQALAHIKNCFGENEDFAVTAANCARVYAAMADTRKAEEYKALARAVRASLGR